MKNPHRAYTAVVFALLFGLASCAAPHKETKAPSISSEDAWKLMQSDTSVVVIDVRTKDEYYGESGHLEGALLIPVQGLELRLEPLQMFKSRKLLVYCRTQNRSSIAADTLAAHGFDATFIRGGITQWSKEGLPVVKEPQ